MADLRECSCVNEADFYRQIEELKSQLKTKDSWITCYVEDNFYDKAKNFVKQKRQRQLGLFRDDDWSDPKEELTKWEQQIITRKKWIYSNNKLFTENKKEVVPKQELFQVLSHAHGWISHGGREITEKWMRENYAEISQKVVNTFVKMCSYHAEKNPLMSHVKSVQRPGH